MVRVSAAGPEGQPEVHLGPGPGRGAWLCAATRSECGALAQRRKAFGKALRRTDDAALWAVLAPQLGSGGGGVPVRPEKLKR